jgi:hypothetical protein
MGGDRRTRNSPQRQKYVLSTACCVAVSGAGLGGGHSKRQRRPEARESSSMRRRGRAACGLGSTPRREKERRDGPSAEEEMAAREMTFGIVVGQSTW